MKYHISDATLMRIAEMEDDCIVTAGGLTIQPARKSAGLTQLQARTVQRTAAKPKPTPRRELAKTTRAKRAVAVR